MRTKVFRLFVLVLIVAAMAAVAPQFTGGCDYEIYGAPCGW